MEGNAYDYANNCNRKCDINFKNIFHVFALKNKRVSDGQMVDMLWTFK